MQDEDRIRLQHIIEEANEVLGFIKGYSLEDFINDGKTIRAVTRSIEIIGEAASKISTEFRKEHRDVPWAKIIGMRNRLIHAYFDIDHEILWQTVKVNIPEIIERIQKLLVMFKS